ncbi:hypothetical protein HanHA300_Chr11g0422231 [Helianthus annuus]|nr:hypothetical protein HanHA300_Chr11g0422231 [Helianthus annuus]KAJ0519227.1 hypothetical protein HanHA89_Chr11g0446431 [Helianthus annuus]KAJ0687218.1 hypothetical protein HanLR1_Chr11g0423641 [Helianthus annuus]
MIYIQDDVHEEQRCLQVKEAFYPPPFAFIQDLNLNLHFFSLHLVSFPSLVLVSLWWAWFLSETLSLIP